MGERGGGWDSDSDETVVEGSVTESDVEGEELHSRRLSFVSKDVSLTTTVRTDEGTPSPEICFIHKVHDHPYALKEEKQINLIPQEMNTSDQSQSLLQGWINCPSLSENISEPVFSLNAAVEGQQNNSLDLNIKVVGYLKDSEDKLVGDQQREKEVVSDQWNANSHEKPTEERSSHSVETDLCAGTTKATSRRAKQLRESSSRKCRDSVSGCDQILQETQQRISHNGNTIRNKAKDFEKIQKSTSKEKQDLETNICQGMVTLNGNGKAEQTRRSERIKKKIRQEASIRSSVNPVFPISLSRINRKNIFGETLLHKAVANEDIDLVCNIIKAGANVNVQDYAGWTALHEASVEGFYSIANELLKAGADVNARGSEQITPLHDAVKEGHYKLAELLLWYGADPLLKDEMGRCAIEEASDQSMKKLLKSYIAKSRRDSEEISAGEDAENMLSAQSLDDTNLHQTELNPDGTIQHDYTKTSKEGFAKNEQSRKTDLVTYTKNKVLQDLEGRRVSEENLKNTNSDSKKTKKSVIDMAKAAVESKITQKSSKHETYVSSLCPSTNQGTITVQNAVFSDVGPNEMGFSVDVSDHNYWSTIDIEGKLSLPNQTEMLQEHGFSSGNKGNLFTEEKRISGSTATSVITGEEETSLHCPTSSAPVEKISVRHSQTTDLTERDSQPILSLTSFHSLSLSKLQQEIKSYDSDQHSLKQSSKDSLTDKNLNTDMRISSEQIISLKNLTHQVKSDVDGNKINGEALSLKFSLPLLQEISLQINESESACANATDSDSRDILQQTITNEVQNIYTNTSEEGTNCTEQALQTNTETLLPHEVLAATNGESVSKSPLKRSSGVLSSVEGKAQPPEEGRRVLLNAEENAKRFLTETAENASNSEIRSTALQLHEKEALQRKRQNLQETNQKTDLHFSINADKKSLYYSQIMQNTEQETSQKTDEGMFAEITGTEGTEKNKEERNAKSDVLSQFTETEAIQTKRVKLDPQKTSQKTDLCSSSSKSKLSLSQSQFSQGSKQQTSKKSETSKKEAAVLHVAYNTRAWMKKRNAKGENQLHIAAKRGDLSLVKTLISSGICVNEKDNAGWTAIHEASNRGFTEVILELLKAGANINSRSLDGTLPIHDAVSGNYLEAVRILLQHGANPHERDDSGESALDKTCDDEMKELLKSYGAIDSGLSVKTTGVTERKYNQPTRSRKSKLVCYDCCKNDDAALVPQHENYSEDESVAVIQDTVQRQKELLLLELRTSKDADAYIQKLSQIQDTLNEMLAKQKTERDALAKKYRASVESFKKGALREKLVKLASRQKSLLTVAQNQKELVQKIQNYRKEKQVYATHAKKQISNTVICYGNGKGQDLTADKIMCPDVVTFSTGPSASMPNGNRVEAHLSLENRFSAQECSQHPNSRLDKTGANKEAIRSKEYSDHALASENRIREYPFNNMLKLTNAVEVVTLPSEPTVSITETKCLQQKDIDCVAIAEQGIKSLNPTSVTNTLNISEARSAVISNNVCQPTSGCEQVLTAEDLHRYVNKKDTFQQQQVIASTSTENFRNAPQQMIIQSSVETFNANSVLTSLVSNTDCPINLNQKSSSQSCNSQDYERKQLKYRRNNRKKLQLIDLLQLGRIKPGENVLEFKLQHFATFVEFEVQRQYLLRFKEVKISKASSYMVMDVYLEFSHKATLLENGKIKTSNRRILQNPVQWVKELLGSDISVTWKYVWNKVTYLGIQLSKFLVEEVSISNDLELPSQQREPVGASFNKVGIKLLNKTKFKF